MSHHDEKTMNLTLYVWRQTGPTAPGKLEQYDAKNVSPDQSFLEMLDEVNEQLIKAGKDPISFDHDCREGICGMCSQVINGVRQGGPAGGAPPGEGRGCHPRLCHDRSAPTGRLRQLQQPLRVPGGMPQGD